MLLHQIRVHLCAGLSICLLIAWSCTSVGASCVIRTARPASSFLCTEAVQFTIASDHPAGEVAWSVTDYYGETRATGRIRAGESSTTLRVVPSPGVGYYMLTLQYESGHRYEKAFCVLPHPDDARGDGGLFGLGGARTSEMLWDAAWQIGARHYRAEFAWTDVERERGRYRLDWVREMADLARERDMQLTVLTGHTPAHYGVRPVDAEGRVAQASYTWQPEDTIEWARYIDAMARELAPGRLRPEPAHRADTLARSGRPLVRAWEVWSEADQNFYYGSWDRYLDMLRIAWCGVRRHGRVPIVYGSCGHMTQLQWTLLSGCGDYFDRVAFHPYHEDPEWMMMHWYRNMPQKLIVAGRMRDTALTECGFHSPEDGGEPGFMPRVYATLKAFGETLFIRSSCLGGVFASGDTRISLAQVVDGELVPRPAYVAFAVTRWLLESARYVGPLDAPDGARMELFLRQGSPLVIGWSRGGPRQVSLEVSPSARIMDAMGRVTRLEGPTATIELTTDAVALLDVAPACFAEAAANGLERALTTELGHESPFDSAYIDPLQEDLADCVGPRPAAELRAALRDACERTLEYPPHGPAEFFGVQRVAGDAMLQVAMGAREHGELTPLHGNTIWRLARLTEALGEIADGLGERRPAMNNVSQDDMQKTLTAISATRSRVAEATGGAECPFADRLLDRSLDLLDRVRQGGGHARGAWWAATLHARAAHALTAVERPVMRRVFATGVFSSADIITKGILLPPGPEHLLRARVYNFLPRDITGTIRANMPENWGGAVPTAPFTAPAGGASTLVDLPFSVPDRPRPWVQHNLSRREWWDTKVDAPPTADLDEEISVFGEMSAGPIERMIYRVYVGSYPSTATQAAPEPPAPQQVAEALGGAIAPGLQTGGGIMRPCVIPMR